MITGQLDDGACDRWQDCDVVSGYAFVVNLVTLLQQARKAAVGHGLVERLQIFERGLVAFLRCLAKVLVDPAMGVAEQIGETLAKLISVVLAYEGVGLEDVGSAAPVRGEQAQVTQLLNGGVIQRFGVQGGRDLGFGSGAVEEALRAQQIQSGAITEQFLEAGQYPCQRIRPRGNG